jgi:hypothetical protein
MHMSHAVARDVHGSPRSTRSPVGALLQAPIDLLRPTQMAVGMRSVTRKMRKVESRVGKRKKIEKLLINRPIPAVCGPDGALFIVDHHHFGMALCLAEVKSAYVQVIEDISNLSRAAFWRRMEADGRLYPYDEFGRRIQPSLLPPTLHALRHDPYRDLAWDVREADGFHKVAEPYAEFRWANFFREHIAPSTIRRDPKEAVRMALKLCKSRLASRLPGYAH